MYPTNNANGELKRYIRRAGILIRKFENEVFYYDQIPQKKRELKRLVNRIQMIKWSECVLTTPLIRYALSYIIWEESKELQDIYYEVAQFWGNCVIVPSTLTRNMGHFEPKWEKQIRNTLAKGKQVNIYLHDPETASYILNDKIDYDWW